MNILLVHNRYRQAGGEDTVVQHEQSLLASNGHTVTLLEADNAGLVEGVDRLVKRRIFVAID